MNSELLKELSNADSVASVEDEVRSILYRELAKHSDEVFSDCLGSIIFHKIFPLIETRMIISFHRFKDFIFREVI